MGTLLDFDRYVKFAKCHPNLCVHVVCVAAFRPGVDPQQLKSWTKVRLQ